MNVTALMQGAVTARPGNTYVHRLGHSLENVEMINMGFCDACRMEAGVASSLGAVGAAAVVVDCGWSSTPEIIRSNAVIFVKTLLSASPSTGTVVYKSLIIYG
jgi:hypothetical protein